MFGFPAKLIAGGAVITIVVLTGVSLINSWNNHQQKIGWDNALAEVSKQNSVASKAAAKVIATTDACFDSGGTFNVETGVCDL